MADGIKEAIVSDYVASIIYLPTVDKSSSYMGSEATRKCPDSSGGETEEDNDEDGETVPLGGSFHPPTQVCSDDVTVVTSPILDHHIQRIVGDTSGDNGDMNFLRILLTDSNGKRKSVLETALQADSGGGRGPRCQRCAGQTRACKRCAGVREQNLAQRLGNASKLVFLSPDNNTTSEAPAYTSLISRQEGEHGIGDCQFRAQSRNCRERSGYRSATAGSTRSATNQANFVQKCEWTSKDNTFLTGNAPGNRPGNKARLRAQTAKPSCHGTPQGVPLTSTPSRRAASANVIRATASHLSSTLTTRNTSAEMVERIKYESQERRVQRLEKELDWKRPRSCKAMRRDRSQSNILKKGPSKESSALTARDKRLRVSIDSYTLKLSNLMGYIGL